MDEFGQLAVRVSLEKEMDMILLVNPFHKGDVVAWRNGFKDFSGPCRYYSTNKNIYSLFLLFATIYFSTIFDHEDEMIVAQEYRMIVIV